MMSLILLMLGFMHESKAASEITIVDVRRNITLAEDDPVYKDFYLNNAPGSGLKKNLVVTAVRKLNIRDASGASAVGEIVVPVGQLKIIAVYDKVAVAREVSLLSRDELPMLEQIGIMTGDRIDLQGSFIDNSKPKPRRKVAEEPPPNVDSAAFAAAVVSPASAVLAPTNPVESASPATPAANSGVAPAQTPEKLENSKVSGNNSRNE